MRSTIILCMLSSCMLIAKAQLNYKAQETQSSHEVVDERTLSKDQFEQSSIDPLRSDQTKFVSAPGDPTTRQKEESKGSIPEVDDSLSSGPDQRVIRHEKPAIILENVPKASSSAKLQTKSESETPDSKYPIDSPQTTDQSSPLSQESLEQSRNFILSHFSKAQSYYADDILSQNSSSSIDRDQAVNKFIQSLTPQESEWAIKIYLAMRERHASLKNHEISDGQTDKMLEQPTNQNPNVVFTNHDNRDSPRQIDNLGTSVTTDLSSIALPNDLNQIANSAVKYQHQSLQYPSLKRNENGGQSRQAGLWAVNDRRRSNGHRGPMRIRGNPWFQSRISPGPSFPEKVPISDRPQSGPPAGPWKQSIEVINTTPSEFDKTSPTNTPIRHEDPGKWYPKVDELSSNQKDIYSSQLDAQSYDPHYYNYIAETDKMRSWLHGKFAKDQEDKNIRWDLHSDSKKQGLARRQKRTVGTALQMLLFQFMFLFVPSFQQAIGAAIVANDQKIQAEMDQQQKQTLRNTLHIRRS